MDVCISVCMSVFVREREHICWHDDRKIWLNLICPAGKNHNYPVNWFGDHQCRIARSDEMYMYTHMDRRSQKNDTNSNKS